MKNKFCFITLKIIAFILLLTVGCQQQMTNEQLRQQYPLYDLPDNGSATYGKFTDMVKTADIGVYATFQQDIQTVSSSIKVEPLETSDPAFNSKHPDAGITADFNLLYLHVDKIIFGEIQDSDILVCIPVSYLKDTVQPHKGDSFFFFLRKGTTNKVIDKFINDNENLKSYPLYSGAPRFYRTTNDRILAILNLDDQKTYDMTTGSDFAETMKKLKGK